MPTFFPRTLYKARARIEQAVGKLKRFKRIALRCEKTAQNYSAVFLSRNMELPALTGALVHEETSSASSSRPREEFDLHQG